jgi:hypothetical protein
MKDHRLIAVSPTGRDIGCDKALVTRFGQRVALSGVIGSPHNVVVKHVPARRLIVVKSKGYTYVSDRMSGPVYEPTHFTVYEYIEDTFDGEPCLKVSLGGLCQFPVNPK